MDTTAKAIESETAATEDIVLSDEFVAEVVKRRKHADNHPDEWISAEESIKRLRERNANI